MEGTVELTCRCVLSEDGKLSIFAVRYIKHTRKWEEKDITEFVPLDECCRLLLLTQEEQRKLAWKMGRILKLW